VLEMGLQFEFGPLGTGTKFVPQRQKVRFKHGTRPLILQLAEDSLSVWEVFSSAKGEKLEALLNRRPQ